jgi:hypothetical protein
MTHPSGITLNTTLKKKIKKNQKRRMKTKKLMITTFLTKKTSMSLKLEEMRLKL